MAEFMTIFLSHKTHSENSHTNLYDYRPCFVFFNSSRFRWKICSKNSDLAVFFIFHVYAIECALYNCLLNSYLHPAIQVRLFLLRFSLLKLNHWLCIILAENFVFNCEYFLEWYTSPLSKW